MNNDRYDQELLQKFLRRGLSNQDGESENSLRFLRQALEKRGLTSADVALVICKADEDDANGIISLVEEQKFHIRNLRSELRTAKMRIQEFDKATAASITRTVRTNQWAEFLELVRTKRHVSANLPSDWRKQLEVSDHFDPAQLRLWETFQEDIPFRVMDVLSEAIALCLIRPVAPVSPVEPPTSAEPSTLVTTAAPPIEAHVVETAAVTSRTATKKKHRRWQTIPASMVKQVAALRFKGMPKTSVAIALGISESQTLIEIRKPPIGMNIVVHQDGPVDWYQLWEMASRLSSETNWLNGLKAVGVISRASFTSDPNSIVAVEMLRMYREDYARYHAAHESSYKAFASLTKGRSRYTDGVEIFALHIANELRAQTGIILSNQDKNEFAYRYNAEFGRIFRLSLDV